MLARLLKELEKQRTNGAFSLSIVVTDNDREETGRPVVEEFSRSLIRACRLLLRAQPKYRFGTQPGHCARGRPVHRVY